MLLQISKETNSIDRIIILTKKCLLFLITIICYSEYEGDGIVRIKKDGHTYLIRVDKDEDICEKLLEACHQHQIKSAVVQGIGACQSAVISTYDGKENQFHDHVYEGLLELISLQGNIVFNSHGELVYHLHSCFSFVDDKNNLTIVGGHLKSAVIGYTGEIILNVLNHEIHTTYNDKVGIEIWDI